MNLKALLFLSIVFISPVTSSFSQHRDISILQTGWKFQLGENKEALKIDFDDSDWEELRIPHDWAIAGPFDPNLPGNTGKLPWKGVGWYRNNIEIPGDYEDKTIYLLFDGVMAFPEIYVNGELAGKWDYGYNSFYLDITKFINPGEKNLIAVKADTREHDSRWYPGAGIYRKVRMLAVDPLHVDIWGTQITTPIIKPHYADVRIRTSIKNDYDRNFKIKVKHKILNQDDKEIATAETEGKVGKGDNAILEVNFLIASPRKWDTEDPHLYKVITEVWEGGSMKDQYFSRFGVREMQFTADNGFYLNGRRVLLKGVNLHHDLGFFGAAFNKRAMERQLRIMKDMGCNAIRTSHNTAAPELIELCDEMGLLVYNEVFDKYDGKADIRDTTDFEDFAHRNIRNFVVRDRNHPSIFIWSVGNEIQDVQFNRDLGFYRLHTMVNYVRKYDHTRPTTMACDQIYAPELRHFDYYDVHSYNYKRRYWLARQLEPNMSVIISESGSTVSTRGFYEFPLPEKPTDFTRSMQISSYDLNKPWWADYPDEDFMWQQKEDYVSGEFVWTGFDYLGEPTPYSSWMLISEFGLETKDESRSSYFGIVDLCGIPKDRYYLYKSYWNPDETTVHILPHWNWEGREGQTTPVFVYTNGDCAELFLNGESLDKQCKQPKSDSAIERFRLMWPEVKFEPGELKAIAYNKGVRIGETTMKTAGEPYRIRLTPDRTKISADGEDLSFILIEAVDRDGNLCPKADHEISISIKGPGRIAGIGNGNPRSLNPFQSDSVGLFYGKAMLITGSDFTGGEIEIEAEAKNLKKASVTIESE